MPITTNESRVKAIYQGSLTFSQELYRSTETRIKVGVFDTPTLVSDLSAFSSFTIEFYTAAPTPSSTSFLEATLDASSLQTLTSFATWISETEQHLTFALSDTETAVTVGADDDATVYVVLFGISGGAQVSLGQGTVRWVNSALPAGGGGGGVDPVTPVDDDQLIADSLDDIVRLASGAVSYPDEQALESCVVSKDVTLVDASSKTFAGVTLTPGWYSVSGLITYGFNPEMSATFAGAALTDKDGNTIAARDVTATNLQGDVLPTEFEDGFSFYVDTETTGDLVFSLSTAHLQGAVLRRADPITGIVCDLGDNFSSGPESVKIGSDLIGVVHDMFDHRGFVTDFQGQAVQVFPEYTGTYKNDKWHAPACIVDLGDGEVVVFRSYHSTAYIEGRKITIKNGKITAVGGVKQFGSSKSLFSYIHAAKLADGTVQIITRGSDGSELTDRGTYNPAMSYVPFDRVLFGSSYYYNIQASTGVAPSGDVSAYWKSDTTRKLKATRIQIDDPTDLEGTTYSVDLLTTTDTRWMYPRGIKVLTNPDDSEEELVATCWAVYNTNASENTWWGTAVLIWDPATNKWYTPNGTEATQNTQNGTLQNARFSTTPATALASSDGYLLIDGQSNNQRYTVEGTFFANAVVWPSEGIPKVACGVVVGEVDADDAEAFGTTLNYYWTAFDGTAETDRIELSGFTVAGDVTPWLAGAGFQTGFGTGIVCLGDKFTQDTDLTPEAATAYYSWGGKAVRVFTISAGFEHTPKAVFLNEFDLAAPYNSYFHFMQGRWLCVHYPVDFISMTHAQCVRTWYDVATFGAVDDFALHSDVAGEFTSIPAKATPVDDDVFLLEDSEDASNKKRVLLSSIATAVSSAGDWAAWAPALTAVTVNPTFGVDAVAVAGYMQNGKALHLRYLVSQGAAGTAGTGAYRIELPLAADLAAAPQGMVVGTCAVNETTVGVVRMVDATHVELVAGGQVVGSDWLGTDVPNNDWSFTAIIPLP